MQVEIWLACHFRVFCFEMENLGRRHHFLQFDCTISSFHSQICGWLTEWECSDFTSSSSSVVSLLLLLGVVDEVCISSRIVLTCTVFSSSMQFWKQKALEAGRCLIHLYLRRVFIRTWLGCACNLWLPVHVQAYRCRPCCEHVFFTSSYSRTHLCIHICFERTSVK